MTDVSTAPGGNGAEKAAASTMFWEGILLIALGTFAIIVPGIFTLAVTTLIGVVLLVGGAVRLWRCIRSRHPGSHVWHIAVALLAIAAGLILLINPMEGVLTLTVVVIALLLAGGAMKLAAAFQGQPAGGRLWLVVSAVVDIALGILLWAGLPETALWAIGLMVGISLLFTGWTAVMVSSALKRGTT